MKNLFALGLALFVSTQSFADIDNPSAEVLAENQELLRRVVSFKSSAGSCTGTWIQPGLILTARHCLPNAIEQIKVLEHPVQLLKIQRTAVQSTLRSLLELGQTDEDTNSDFGVLVVDPAELAAENLPVEPVEWVEADDKEFKSGTEFLIAGFGIQHWGAINEYGTKNAGLMKSIRSKHASNYRITSGAKREFEFKIEAKAGQKIEDIDLSSGFHAKNSRSGSLVLSGDSGGPAFVKHKGKWVIAGIASSVGLLPAARKLYVEFIRGDESQSYKLVSDQSRKDRRQVDFDQIAFQTFKELNQSYFRIDGQHPFAQDWSYTVSTSGEVECNHVSLKSVEVRKTLDAMINNSVKLLKDAQKI